MLVSIFTSVRVAGQHSPLRKGTAVSFVRLEILHAHPFKRAGAVFQLKLRNFAGDKIMSLDLVEPGSLEKPGPIGRTFRFMLGLLCFYGLYEIVRVAPYFVTDPIGLLSGMSLMILVAVCIFNYVINIGFSRNWNSFPVLVILAILGIAATISYLVLGTANSPLVGIPIMIWLSYFFAHLGLSFVLAAILGTPGCEMRAIPQLLGKITHRESMEHYCPSSIISGIDRWETQHFKRN